MINRSARWTILALVYLIPVVLSAPSECDYSCPERNLNAWDLAATPTALGWDSPYSIFECVYSQLQDHKLNKVTCSYYKNNGEQAIGYAGDACYPQAVNCSSVDTPKFSLQGKYETPPWIEHSRYMAHLLGHPIGSG